MSTLQIGLAIAGGVVLAGVVAHSTWTSRKNKPRQAEPLPQQTAIEPVADQLAGAPVAPAARPSAMALNQAWAPAAWAAAASVVTACAITSTPPPAGRRARGAGARAPRFLFVPMSVPRWWRQRQAAKAIQAPAASNTEAQPEVPHGT
mgnify:CR=1 FL=1